MRSKEDLKNRYDQLVRGTERDWGIDSTQYVDVVIRDQLSYLVNERIEGFIEGLTVPELLTMLDIAEQALTGTKVVEAPKKKAKKTTAKVVQ